MSETTYENKSVWSQLWDKNLALSKMDSAELNLSRAIRNGYPEIDIEMARGEYAYRQTQYQPYCPHDWVDMSTGNGDDIHEIVKCVICGMDKEVYDQAHALNCDLDELP